MHLSPVTGFLRLEDLIGDQGDVALVVEYDNKFPDSSAKIAFSEISPLPSLTDISLCYFDACDTNQCTNTRKHKDCDHEHSVRSTCMISSNDAPLATFAAKKKYKPVARKVRPILDTLPSNFRIEHNIIGDPLTNLPNLSPHPPPSPCTVATLKSDVQKWTTYTPPISYGLPNTNYSIILSPFRTKASLGTIPSTVIFAKISSPLLKFPL